MPAPLAMRRLACAFVCVAALALAACERIAVGPEIAGELSRGRRWVGTLSASVEGKAPAQLDSQSVIALGYLERDRLGLGSPFRLIDYAVRDPRLDDSVRTRLAWALLARTLDGAGEQVNPIVLDSLGAGRASSGREQLALIESAVHGDDPRAGELAVRLAYSIAAAERTLAPRAPLLAARVAALARDRWLARADARDLLRQARHDDTDPLSLIQLWRTEHRFRVEQPPMAPLPEDVDREATKRAPELLAELRELAAAPADSAKSDREDAARADTSTFLTHAVAVRLAQLARAENAPPQSPVVLAISGYRRALMASSHTRWAHWASAHFIARARTEEALAAERALVAGHAPDVPVALATLSAAVWLRGYAQEVPWFPGDPGPSARELKSRFGLAAVTFDDDVPETWQPYYRAMLLVSLQDLRRVLPSVDLDGLRVHFGDRRLRGAALAMHDPEQRVIYLPLATSAGTIAHEVAHDIDWQAARTRYAVRGDYATDRAMREARGPLALSVRGLTAASLVPLPADGAERAPVSQRPTEVFARALDWFVAASLAHEGRIDGYLSSVQDELLTGYVTVTAPDVSGSGGSSLVRVLDDVAQPDVPARAWFLDRYGPARALSPYELVRGVLESPLDTASAPEPEPPLDSLLAATREARDRTLVHLARERCGMPQAMERDDAARRRLVLLAAESRALGILRDHARSRVVDAANRMANAAALSPLAAARPWLLGDLVRPALDSTMLAEVAALADSVPVTTNACVVERSAL